MAQRTNNSTKLPIAMAALAAEPLFQIGNVPITNSMVNAWVAAILFIVGALIASRRKTLVPRGIHNFFEAVVEAILGQMEQVMGSMEKAKKYFPLIATIFLFVLVNNWLGLLPGTGTIGIHGMVHGHQELIPLLRPATADLNMTLAIAAVAVLTTHIAAFRTIGASNHLSKFINIRGIWRALKKGPLALVIAVIEFFVGFLEIIGEFSKTLSLSLRLFGNVFAGEILIGVMLGLVSYVVPIPFYFLEILVGIIQATVFSMLTMVYLTVATTSHDEHDHEEGHAEAGGHDEGHPATAHA